MRQNSGVGTRKLYTRLKEKKMKIFFYEKIHSTQSTGRYTLRLPNQNSVTLFSQNKSVSLIDETRQRDYLSCLSKIFKSDLFTLLFSNKNLSLKVMCLNFKHYR